MLIDLKQPEYIDIYKELTRTYYEFQGHQNIIMYMITNGMKDTEEYQFYFKEYIKKDMDYEICKRKFENILKEKNSDIIINKWKILFEKDAVQID